MQPDLPQPPAGLAQRRGRPSGGRWLAGLLDCLPPPATNNWLDWLALPGCAVSMMATGAADDADRALAANLVSRAWGAALAAYDPTAAGERPERPLSGGLRWYPLPRVHISDLTYERFLREVRDSKGSCQSAK